MEIPITREMTTQNAPIDVRIEERAQAEYDLSGDGEYVDLGSIEGRLLVEYEANRGELVEVIERAEEPTIRDRLNMVLENWSHGASSADELRLNYGRLVLRGTDPLDEVEPSMPLRSDVSVQRVEETSPSDLKRELRQEIEYETNHSALESDLRDHLEREGVPPSEYEIGVPIHIQARADPIADENEDVFGTEFTLTVRNNRRYPTRNSSISLSMPPEIGREAELGPNTTGTYDPADEVYEFVIDGLGPGENTAVSFVVPPSAGRDLEQVAGEAEIHTDHTFSYLWPYAVFDAGGEKVYDMDGAADAGMADVSSTCAIEAEFHTPTSAITVGEGAEVTKRLTVEGVTPPTAAGEIESILSRRGLDASGPNLEETREMHEDAEVTKFNGEFTDASVVVEDTRIAVRVAIKGERRTGEVEATREEGESLPAQRRNVSMAYGRVGVDIVGRGADNEKVESYVNDLRNDIQMTLDSMATEV
ncbi:hypothetical protein JCM30237_05520 [Halolamina litorea]|uniref:Uncharacterized protein n=1 Tax=Halolamina litorea TaxID=1515593 RepID=A0ABD6BQP8_9EURY|nr:hypothetical protein [Halolamina litorea]